MSVLKNSFGVSVAFDPKVPKWTLVDRLAGSSLERKEKEKPDLIDKDPMEILLAKPLKIDEEDETQYKLRSLSRRSKTKIRKKVIAFSRVVKKLSFVTLTFLNKVTDRQAIQILGAFLDNVGKRSKDFQYLWVAEKQTRNQIFKDNIHFHMITNKFWKIDRWWNYWLDVQKKFGVVPRDEHFKPSSAFDVKVINSNNIKGVGNYITKYITKNEGQYRCMVWNCSRKISQLYTDFYSDMEFLRLLQKMQAAGSLGGEIKTFQEEHCNIHCYPLNINTTNFYNRIDEQNTKVWNQESSEKLK